MSHQNGRAGGHISIGLEAPDNSLRIPVGRYHRIRSRIAVGFRGCGGGTGQQSIHQRKCLQSVDLPPIIDRSVPIRRRAPGAYVTNCIRQLLHYLVAGGVVSPKILAIEQVHFARLSSLDQQIWITSGGLCRNDHQAPGCLVHVPQILLGLTRRCEIILNGRYAIREVQIENAVSKVHTGRIRCGRRDNRHSRWPGRSGHTDD